MLKEINAQLKKLEGLLLFLTLLIMLSSFAYVLRNNYNAERNLFKNFIVETCLNFSVAENFVSGADQKPYEWNVRYSTNFYRQNWSFIMKKYDYSSFSYISRAVTLMENINRQRDRLESEVGLFASESYYQEQQNETATQSKIVLERLNNFGINFESCTLSDFF